MAHLIDKDSLVAEIKRLLDKYTSVHTFNYGATQDLNHLLSFLDTLEVEEVQEEPVDKCKGCNNVKGCITCVDGDQWAHYEEPVREELGKYINELSKQFPDVSFAKLSRIAVRVAKWQKEQMMSKAIVREVKVDAGGYPYIDITELYDYDKDMPLAKEGDKVKVIILNDE